MTGHALLARHDVGLDSEHHTGLVYAVARAAVTAVPDPGPAAPGGPQPVGLPHLRGTDRRRRSRTVIKVFIVSDGSRTAEYCPYCGRGIEWVLRREVMV